MPALAWDRLHRLLLIGGGGVILAWALVSLTWPFGWDHGIYAWVGDAIVRGGLPYRDAWDVKGPVVYYTFAALQTVLGRGAWPLRLFDLLLLALTLWPFYRALVALGGGRAGAWGIVLVSLWYARLGYYHTAQPDSWVGQLLMASFSLLITPATGGWRPRVAIALGAAIGLATLMKPIYGLFLLLPLWHVVRGRSSGSGGAGRMLAVGAGAFAVPIGLAAAWFATQGGGAWAETVDAYIRFNLGHTQAQHGLGLRGAAIDLYRATIAQPSVLLALPFAALGLTELRRRHRDAAELVIGWLGLAVVCLGVQAWTAPYRWHIATPPLALLTALGIASAITERPDAGGNATLPRAALVLLLGLSALTPARDSVRFLRTQAGWLSRAAYEESFQTPYGPSPFASRRLGARLRTATPPTEAVLVYDDPAAAYYAERPWHGRYTFRVPLRGDGSDPTRTARVGEFLRDLTTNPPRFIALARTDLVDSLDAMGHLNRTRIAGLVDLLHEGYSPEDTTEGYLLYRRR